MDIILFLILACITIILSIKLSYYTDIIDRQSNIGSFFIGGIMLAAITSIPELFTSISAVTINNPYLSVGDILGSNIFNFCALSFFDLCFLKVMIMNRVSKKYGIFILLLIINYVSIKLTFESTKIISFFNIGISSFIILITYIVFLYFSSFIKDNSIKKSIIKKDKNVKYKFILTTILMISTSIFLTLTVDHISKQYTLISISSIGAFLLGITTSLPEIVSSITLIRMKSYSLAISNIVGTNMFNLLVLVFVDVICKKGIIYSYVESSSLLMIKLCIITSIFLFVSIMFKCKNKVIYIIPKILIISCYIFMMIIELKIIK